MIFLNYKVIICQCWVKALLKSVCMIVTKIWNFKNRHTVLFFSCNVASMIMVAILNISELFNNEINFVSLMYKYSNLIELRNIIRNFLNKNVARSINRAAYFHPWVTKIIDRVAIKFRYTQCFILTYTTIMDSSVQSVSNSKIIFFSSRQPINELSPITSCRAKILTIKSTFSILYHFVRLANSSSLTVGVVMLVFL